jgi:hypothetical protein
MLGVGTRREPGRGGRADDVGVAVDQAGEKGVPGSFDDLGALGDVAARGDDPADPAVLQVHVVVFEDCGGVGAGEDTYVAHDDELARVFGDEELRRVEPREHDLQQHDAAEPAEQDEDGQHGEEAAQGRHGGCGVTWTSGANPRTPRGVRSARRCADRPLTNVGGRPRLCSGHENVLLPPAPPRCLHRERLRRCRRRDRGPA